jgi:hypothetical protein
MWMDFVLALIVIFPLLCWSGAHIRRSRDPLPEIREAPAGFKLLEFPARPADRPHQSPAA